MEQSEITVVNGGHNDQVYEYLEARIEAMKRRVATLEAENDRLHFELFAAACCKSDGKYIASA